MFTFFQSINTFLLLIYTTKFKHFTLWNEHLKQKSSLLALKSNFVNIFQISKKNGISHVLKTQRKVSKWIVKINRLFSTSKSFDIFHFRAVLTTPSSHFNSSNWKVQPHISKKLHKLFRELNKKEQREAVDFYQDGSTNAFASKIVLVKLPQQSYNLACKWWEVWTHFFNYIPMNNSVFAAAANQLAHYFPIDVFMFVKFWECFLTNFVGCRVSTVLLLKWSHG